MVTRTPFRELTADQERQFLDQGYVVVEQAVARDLAEQWRDLAFRRLGYDPDDPATWSEVVPVGGWMGLPGVVGSTLPR